MLIKLILNEFIILNLLFSLKIILIFAKKKKGLYSLY